MTWMAPEAEDNAAAQPVTANRTLGQRDLQLNYNLKIPLLGCSNFRLNALFKLGCIRFMLIVDIC